MGLFEWFLRRKLAIWLGKFGMKNLIWLLITLGGMNMFILAIFLAVTHEFVYSHSPQLNSILWYMQYVMFGLFGVFIVIFCLSLFIYAMVEYHNCHIKNH